MVRCRFSLACGWVLLGSLPVIGAACRIVLLSRAGLSQLAAFFPGGSAGWLLVLAISSCRSRRCWLRRGVVPVMLVPVMARSVPLGGGSPPWSPRFGTARSLCARSLCARPLCACCVAARAGGARSWLLSSAAALSTLLVRAAAALGAPFASTRPGAAGLERQPLPRRAGKARGWASGGRVSRDRERDGSSFKRPPCKVNYRKTPST